MIGLAACMVMTVVAALWSSLVVYGNGMSDNPSQPFQGGWSIAVVWIGSALAWAYHFYG